MTTKQPKRRMERVFLRTGFILPILLLAGVAKLSAQCYTAALVVNTGWYNAAPLAIGVNDPLWTCTNKTGDFLGSAPTPTAPALVVQTTGSPYVLGWASTTSATGQWICDNQGHVTNASPMGQTSNLTFERTFCLTTPAPVTFNLTTRADGNIARIMVDGFVYVGAGPNSTWGTSSLAWTVPAFTQTLTAGTHRLQIEISNPYNNGRTLDPVGLLVTGTLTASSAVFVNNQSASCANVPCSAPPVSANCSDSCYWKVTGNNILNGNTIFGTLSNDDIQIFSNNLARGIITKTGRFGFGSATPGNTVEITGSGASTSGLRFTNLTSSSTSLSNPGSVLSVNASGDVILVSSPTGGGGSGAASEGLSFNGTDIQLGEHCQSQSGVASLHSNRAVPMNDFNLIFRDGNRQTKFTNRIGLGTPQASCTPGAKLEVIRNDEGNAYDFDNRAIAGINDDVHRPGGASSGVYGEAHAPQAATNIGGDFLGANGNQETYGVRALANANGAQNAFGGYFDASGAAANYGIYAQAAGSNNPGTPPPGGPSYAGYFNGDVFSTFYYTPSDKRVKQNVQPISNALDLIGKIQPKKYQFNTRVYPALQLPANGDQYGVISQELETVLPSLVKETQVPGKDQTMTQETIKAVNYTALIPILIQAVKDQQAQIAAQQKSIDALTARLEATTANRQAQDAAVNRLDVLISNDDLAVLDQNNPNPFDKQTSIAYYLPQRVKVASMRFANLDGKVVKTLDIPSRGKGVLNVYSADLAPGAYVYTLFADGEVVATKKMIIQR